jgi:hypothetical protein
MTSDRAFCSHHRSCFCPCAAARLYRGQAEQARRWGKVYRLAPPGDTSEQRDRAYADYLRYVADNPIFPHMIDADGRCIRHLDDPVSWCMECEAWAAS